MFMHLNALVFRHMAVETGDGGLAGVQVHSWQEWLQVRVRFQAGEEDRA